MRRTIPVRDLSHLQAFSELSRSLLPGIMATSIAECPHGMHSTDRSTSHRNSLFIGLDGRLVPGNGPLTLVPFGPNGNQNTTWLEVPSPVGVEPVMVNAGRFIDEQTFRLCRGEVMGVDAIQMNLIPRDDQGNLNDFLIAMQFRIRKSGDGVSRQTRATVKLLGGQLDKPSRSFLFRYSEVLLDQVFGDAPGFDPGDASGPSPVVR